MANENRQTKIALFLVMLMVLTPLASAASVTDFSSGTNEADILLNDASIFSNTDDASIDLPAGESITSASMAISSNPAVHGSHVRVDIDTKPRVWNPAWNGQTTKFSNIQDFQFEGLHKDMYQCYLSSHQMMKFVPKNVEHVVKQLVQQSCCYGSYNFQWENTKV